MDQHTYELLKIKDRTVSLDVAVHWFSQLQIEAVMKLLAVKDDPSQQKKQMTLMIGMLRGTLQHSNH